MTTIQPAYHALLGERSSLQATHNAVLTKLDTLTGRVEAFDTERATWAAEKAVLKSELDTARKLAAASTVPDIALLLTTQAANETLTASMTVLERRFANLQKDFDFTREAYQLASGSATSLTAELADLQSQTADLQRRADGNALRVAEIQRDAEMTAYQDKIEQLQAVVKDREMELDRKLEELRLKTVGRRETRGTSVPRSPRLGGGSPRVGAGGRLSRAGSPAVGELGGGMSSLGGSAVGLGSVVGGAQPPMFHFSTINPAQVHGQGHMYGHAGPGFISDNIGRRFPHLQD